MLFNIRIYLIIAVFIFPLNIIIAAPVDLFIPITENRSLFSKAKTLLNEISAKEKQIGVNVAVLASIPDSLNIDLFGTIVTAMLDNTEKLSKDSFSWVGHIEDKNNQVILIISGSLVQGNITYKNKQYHIRYVGNLSKTALHILRLVDPARLRGEHSPNFKKKVRINAPTNEAPDVKTIQKNILGADAKTDSGEFIDVMVLWTPAAEQGAGGFTAINALINLAVVETNQSYVNSDIALRLRLAHKQKISYTESKSIITDLSRLGSKNDGYIDNIHALRDTYKVDLVSLFASIPGMYCGISDVPLISFWEQAAFSVIDYNCAVDNKSFAHETGHNFSARHDWRTDSDTSSSNIYPYSHGYLTDGNNSWRTIMSYQKCTGSGSCTRLNYWSNPDKQYSGVSMGVPEGALEAADNRKTLNNAAVFVANYRVSGIDTHSAFTNWDIDGNGKADALTDGLLVLRSLFGFTDDALVNNGIGIEATRTTAVEIQSHLKKGVDNGVLDIDANGEVDALTDGLLLLRYLFGFRGNALIDNAVGRDANRQTAEVIKAYLDSKQISG